MKLISRSFETGERIPVLHSGDGLDLSPPLHWIDTPPGCVEYALTCEDPDAPRRPGMEHPFVHWLVYNIPADIHSLPQGLPPEESLEQPRIDQGLNSFGRIGFGGPMPPIGHGTHHYVFKLYALNTKLRVPPAATRTDLIRHMSAHVLDVAQLIGTYERADGMPMAA